VLLVLVALVLFPFLLLWALIALVHDGVQAVDRGSRLGQPVVWTIAVVAVLGITLVAGASRPSRTDGGGTASTGDFAIVSPPSGSTVTTASVTVVGTAPDGAEVVWDRSLRSDVRTVAVSGQWSMAVELDEGANELTFRLGSDRSTAVTLTITFAPSQSATPPSVSASASAPPAGSTPSAQPTATPPPAATAQPTTTAKPLPTPPLASIEDPKGDFVDENDKPAKGPAFMDIIGVYVKTNSDGSLNLALETAGEPPSTWDPVSEEIVYGFYLDTTGDHTPDYQVLLQNDFNNSWTASLSELSTGQTLAGDRFPGVAGVIGTMAAIRLDMSTIGDPGHVAVSALSEYITFPDPQNDPFNSSQRDDTAPDNAWPDGDGWIEFEVPQGS
jgi:hypothetical protein